MNKITGAYKLSEKDVANIEMLVKKGLTNAEISVVTGWSPPVIGKIRNGSYYELNARINEKRQAEREKKNNPAPVPVSQPSVPPQAADYLSAEKLERLCVAIEYNNALMNGVVNKLIAICESLGVNHDGGKKE